MLVFSPHSWLEQRVACANWFASGIRWPHLTTLLACQQGFKTHNHIKKWYIQVELQTFSLLFKSSSHPFSTVLIPTRVVCKNGSLYCILYCMYCTSCIFWAVFTYIVKLELSTRFCEVLFLDCEANFHQSTTSNMAHDNHKCAASFLNYQCNSSSYLRLF